MYNKIVTIDNYLIYKDDGTGNNDGKIYVNSPSVNAPMDFPETPPTSTFIGDTVEPFGVAPQGWSGYPTGIFVSPNQEFIFIKKQSGTEMKIYATATGELVKVSESVPDLTLGSSFDDGRIYLTKDYQNLLSFVDSKTLAKYYTNGDYAGKYYRTTTSNIFVCCTEHEATGDIYVCGRYNNGIDVIDSDFNFIRHMPLSKDINSITIIGNTIYIAAYLSSIDKLIRMDLDGSNFTEITHPEFNTLTTVTPSTDGTKLYLLNYDGLFIIYDIALDEIILSNQILPAGHPGGTHLYVDPWGINVYAVGLFVDQYMTYKLS